MVLLGRPQLNVGSVASGQVLTKLTHMIVTLSVQGGMSRGPTSSRDQCVSVNGVIYTAELYDEQKRRTGRRETDVAPTRAALGQWKRLELRGPDRRKEQSHGGRVTVNKRGFCGAGET